MAQITMPTPAETGQVSQETQEAVQPQEQTTQTEQVARRRRINPLLMIALMALPIFIVLALGWALIESNQGQVSSGLAPDFTLTTYDDTEFTLSSYRGQVVVINFWASWCAPCRSEASELNALYDEYRAKGVMIVGVGYLDNETAARAYLEEFGVQFPTGHDAGTAISKAYRIRGVPETFIIDKRGNVRHMFISTVTARQLRPLLDSLLAEPINAPEAMQ